MFFSFSELGIPFPYYYLADFLFGVYFIFLGTLHACYNKYGNFILHNNKETYSKLFNLD